MDLCCCSVSCCTSCWDRRRCCSSQAGGIELLAHSLAKDKSSNSYGSYVNDRTAHKGDGAHSKTEISAAVVSIVPSTALRNSSIATSSLFAAISALLQSSTRLIGSHKSDGLP